MSMKTSSKKVRHAEERQKKLLGGKKTLKNALFIVVFVASFIYIAWRLVFTLPIQYGLLSIICGVVLWVSESATAIETFTHFNNVRKVKIPEMPEISDDMFLDVDVMIATHNESVELLYKTVNGCKYMRYPDKSKVHIYLCDDGNRPEVHELAKHLDVGYFGFDGNKHAKAGNLNYALERTGSPLIAIFDADMIPTNDFLLETVPYFFLREMIRDEDGTWRKRLPEDGESDEKELGYIQTQQSFYNPDLFQRNLYMEQNAPNEQDYFYRSVNVARMHTESAAFAGSNVVFSRKALEDIGGLATHSITEDFATSIDILGKGYRSIAVAKEVAHGLSPDDAVGFIKQRQRWSRGAAQGIMNKKFWFGKMPLKAKWNFLTAYFYWWTFIRRLIFILCPILYGLFGIHVADVTFWQLMAVWLPYYIIYNLGLKRMSGRTTSALWSDRLDTIQFPYMISPIILGTLMIPQRKFFVTPKYLQSGRNSTIKLAIPHIILAVLSVITIFVCTRQVFAYQNEGAIIVLFWTVYNLFALIGAIVYYQGRINHRDAERIAAEVNVKMFLDQREVTGITQDVSETGLSVLLENPEYLPDNEGFWLEISNERYCARLKVEVRQVWNNNGKWTYGLKILETETERDKQEYLQIIYDRQHQFSRLIDTGVVRDTKRIYEGVMATQKKETRKLPRISLDKKLETAEGAKVEVVDFNYRYALIKGGKQLPSTITFSLPGSDLPVIAVKEGKAGAIDALLHGELYRIENWQELTVNPRFRSVLFEYARQTNLSDMAEE